MKCVTPSPRPRMIITIMHNQRGMVNSRMQERCRSRNGEPALQSAGLPDVARRRKSLKLSGSRPVMAVKSFGDRGAQGGEGIRPRIVETRRRPSQVFVNGTGTIAYLPHDRFTIRGGDLAKAQRSMSRNHVDDARFIEFGRYFCDGGRHVVTRDRCNPTMSCG